MDIITILLVIICIILSVFLRRIWIKFDKRYDHLFKLCSRLSDINNAIKTDVEFFKHKIKDCENGKR